MEGEGFGAFIRRIRESKNLPLRKVAAFLDIDTSTLSKIERGERAGSTEYLKQLSVILETELRVIETIFIADKITRELGGLEHLNDGLKEVEKQIKRKRK